MKRLQVLFDKLWNQADNSLEPVVFYMLSFISLDPDLEQVFIEAEQKMAVSFFFWKSLWTIAAKVRNWKLSIDIIGEKIFA